MKNTIINELIGLIYDAAIEPAKWTDLLNAFAEYVDHVDNQTEVTGHHILSVIPDMADTGNKKPAASISETLKSITAFNTNDPEQQSPSELGEVNDVLIEHFARALKIAKRLIDIDEQHEVVFSVLDRLPIALVLVDKNSRLIESNALADELLKQGEGLSQQSGCLRASSYNQEKLLKAVRQMAKHDPATSRGQALVMNHEETQNSLMLFLAPVKNHGNEGKASVAIFIAHRKSQPLSLPGELSELYGLTEKELAVTSQLVRGLSVKEISEEASVSQHTVRSHVKSVMKKTQTSRQAELVSLVYNGMGSFINSVPVQQPGSRKNLLTKARAWNKEYQVLMLKDGRNLAYQQYGVANGEVLIHCHSVLGSRHELALDADEICRQKNVRLIVADRPGFGASDPDPDMSFINWARDLLQLADELKLEQFLLSGYAMGGQYALACAHEFPERIKRIALISCGMPAVSSEDFKPMIPLYKMNIRLAKHLPKIYKLLSNVLVKGIIEDPATFFSQLSKKLGEADQQVMASEQFKKEMFSSLLEGFCQGGKATAMEIIQLMHDWQFKPAEIKVPIDIWHGGKDCHVPLVLSQRLDNELKDSRYNLLEEQGHFLFYTQWSAILDKLTK
ncbi:MAG: alpha/beta fold hydrolase [Gammaproteobacteria bacterium]|nr:alpha/beta fold hydrolase [Gammaproteobacteria bacterium]